MIGMVRILILGGPLDGQFVRVPPQVHILDTPTGRYVRSGHTGVDPIFSFMPLTLRGTPVTPNRWAKKKRPVVSQFGRPRTVTVVLGLVSQTH